MCYRKYCAVLEVDTYHLENNNNNNNDNNDDDDESGEYREEEEKIIMSQEFLSSIPGFCSFVPYNSHLDHHYIQQQTI